MAADPVFDRRVRLAAGAILGGIGGVFYAPSFEGQFAMVGIGRGPAALVTIALFSVGCGYLFAKVRV